MYIYPVQHNRFQAADENGRTKIFRPLQRAEIKYARQDAFSMYSGEKQYVYHGRQGNFDSCDTLDTQCTNVFL